MDSPMSQDLTAVVLAKNNTPQLEGVHYTKIGGTWNLKHEIVSPEVNELFINT